MPGEEIFGIASVIISLTAAAIYLWSIARGMTKPHFCTHFVWAVSSLIVCLAQVSEEAGPGSWVSMINTVFFILTTILSLKWGERTIMRSDWAAMSFSLLAIIPWILTKNPLWSVILITAIDVVAYYPTLRKSWSKPGEENLTTYSLSSLEYSLSIPAMRVSNLTTLLYPATIIISNVVLISICLYRRHSIRSSPARDVSSRRIT